MNEDVAYLFPEYLLQSKSFFLLAVDWDGKIIFSNGLLRDILSNTNTNITNLPFIDCIDSKDKDLFFSTYQSFINSKIQSANIILTLSETQIQINWEISVLKNQENATIGLTFLGYPIQNNLKATESISFSNDDYQHLDLVAKRTSNAVIITDKERNIKWVNEGFTRITGYTFEEAVGNNPSFLQFEGSDAKVIQEVREKLDREEPVLFEILNKAKQGHTYWLEVEIQPIKDEYGILTGFMAIETDITLRKQSEELIAISEKRLIASLNNTPNVAIQWYDESGRVIYWNPASELFYGWKSEEAVGKTLDQLIHTPEETEEFLKILEQIDKTGEAYGPYEASTVGRDGITRWVLATTFSIPLGNQKKGYVCMDVDITIQKRISNELIESEERYRSVISAIGEGLVLQDIDGKIIMCNQSAADILGLTLNQLKGKDSYDPLWQALKEDGMPFLPEEHPAMITLRTGQPVDNVLMNVHSGDGQRKYIIINARPVLNHKGEMYAAVASFNDITQLKNAERALLKSNRELMDYQKKLEQNIEELYASQAKIEEQKQQLEEEMKERNQAEIKIIAQNEILRDIARKQSHDIRRPVANILGIVSLMTDSNRPNETRQNEYLELLSKATLELDLIIHQIVRMVNTIEEDEEE